MNETPTEELLARVGRGRNPTLAALDAVKAWVREFEVRPGYHEAAIASELYYHFTTWCAEEGHRATSHAWFLTFLRRKVKLVATRKMRNRVDRRPYRMHTEPARYFRDWIKINPIPPEKMLRSTNRRTDDSLVAEVTR